MVCTHSESNQESVSHIDGQRCCQGCCGWITSLMNVVREQPRELMQDASFAAFVRGEDVGSMQDDATFLLDFYDTFKDFVASDVTDIALSSLAKIDGRFGALFISIVLLHTKCSTATAWKLLCLSSPDGATSGILSSCRSYLRVARFGSVWLLMCSCGHNTWLSICDCLYSATAQFCHFRWHRQLPGARDCYDRAGLDLVP